jgi:nitrogen regulatory protein PII
MKLVLITYDEAHDHQVMQVLHDAGAHNYTRWTEVQGVGHSGGPHLGTPVWPKQNHVLAIAVEDQQAAQIVEGIRALRQSLTLKGIKAFVLPLEEAT